MTLSLNLADVHNLPTPVLAAQTIDAGQLDIYGVIAMAVAIMLLGFALQWARGLVSSLWAMSKLLFRALGVVVALVAALVVLVGVIVLSTVGS